MKGRKISGILAALTASALLLSGCSFDSAMQSIVSFVTKGEDIDTGESVVSSSSESGIEVNTKKFDSSLQEPTFTQDLSGTVNVTTGTEVTLQVIAGVGDGGTVGYQWYSNNVDSNGGGTLIEGATGSSYTPDTSEKGKTYYYVVAINDHGDTINESTSSTEAVAVWDNMYWQYDSEAGGYQYLNRDDGTYPSDSTMEIDGVTYTFDENGYAIDPSTGDKIDVNTGDAVTSSSAADAVEAEDVSSGSASE
ncbi:MAG: hypothetical protein SOI56_02820 [Eubacteriales bacterium]